MIASFFILFILFFFFVSYRSSFYSRKISSRVLRQSNLIPYFSANDSIAPSDDLSRDPPLSRNCRNSCSHVERSYFVMKHMVRPNLPHVLNVPRSSVIGVTSSTFDKYRRHTSTKSPRKDAGISTRKISLRKMFL